MHSQKYSSEEHRALRELARAQARAALEEDSAFNDPSAQLLGSGAMSRAQLWCREEAILCGKSWVDAVYEVLDAHHGARTTLSWNMQDGDTVRPNDAVLQLCGEANILLSGERVALNFLQLLSGIATQCAHYRQLLGNRPVMLLDTRKTLPGLRSAQKYAVRMGGGVNHRASLCDAFMLKENHLHALDEDIPTAIAKARARDPSLTLIVEVENLHQLDLATRAGADIALLDNFSLTDIRKATRAYKNKILLEASGNITQHNICDIADTGVDRISVGALTKNVSAIDFSMRFDS